MSDAENPRKEDIEALLAERKKYEAWLAQLESRRATASDHVFARVFADYSARLDAVRTRLGDQAEAIEGMVADLEKRLGHEQDKIAIKTDERAEAELRAMVGEFGDKEWENTRSRLDSSIKSLRARFDSTERELADLKGLLLSVRGAPAPARPSMEQAAAATVDAALVDAADPEEMIAAADPVQSDAAEVGASDDLAQVPAAEPAAEGAAADDPGAAVPEADVEPVEAPSVDAAPARAPTPFDELAFLKSVAATPTSPKGTAAVATGSVAGEAEAVEPPTGARASSSRQSEEPEPSPLGAPTPRTSQAIRSLKCGECGTLNFPTEWYCERCGGELAAF